MSEITKILIEIFFTILNYWWIFLPIVLFFSFKYFWLYYLSQEYLSTVDWVLLQIQIPRQSERTPKAMEQILAALHAIHDPPNFIERYWKGITQLWFSLEMVSINGTVRFFIKTPVKYRNLVEAQIYAQYPDAEIVEVEDYILSVPSQTPAADYDLWGTELTLTKESAYPIRTYVSFEERESKKEELKQASDPTAALAEVLGKLEAGEQIWIQILIRPVGAAWNKEAQKIVNKLLGRKEKQPKGFASWILYFIDPIMEIIYGKYEVEVKKKEEREPALSPGERDVVHAMEKNISKLGYQTAIRLVYLGQREKFSRAHVSGLLGSFKQFNTLNLNGFKINKKTITSKFSFNWFRHNAREFARKRFIFLLAARRDFDLRVKPVVFNTESLATIYHFPGVTVEAPLVPRVEIKKGEPPPSLPIV